MSDDSRDPRQPTATDEPVVLDRAQVARLQAAIERLRTRDREIFVAACRDHLPYDEIARQHRCSVVKVRKVIAKVLVSLHQTVWPQPDR